MAVKKKRILVVPVHGVGHVNACMGATSALLKYGHQVAFFLEQTFQGTAKKRGFDEFLYEWEAKIKDEKCRQNPGDEIAHILLDKKIFGNIDVYTQLKNMIDCFVIKQSDDISRVSSFNNQLKKTIDHFQPDLFIVDNVRIDPAIFYSDKPWVKLVSTVPLFYLQENDELPPAWTGLGIDSDPTEWTKYRKLLQKFIYSSDVNDLIEEMGYERYPNDLVMPNTQKLTIYAFPEEYNYPQIKKLTNWFNLEVFNGNPDQKHIKLEELVPKYFFDDDLNGTFTGKWIYVSMGSMGSVDLDLMNRLIKTLSKTNHKYIVSKGPRHYEYELTGNLWGERYLPQEEILPIVDLVITHGGNNTVTETFAQGKPMIILPLFADQHDNGQRLHETKWAIKLNTYSFTEQQMIESIDRLLNDHELKMKLDKASKRIRALNKHEILCQLIDEILEQSEDDKQMD